MVIFKTSLKVISKAIAKNHLKNTKKKFINTKEGRRYQTGEKDKQNANSKIVAEYQHSHKEYYKR